MSEGAGPVIENNRLRERVRELEQQLEHAQWEAKAHAEALTETIARALKVEEGDVLIIDSPMPPHYVIHAMRIFAETKKAKMLLCHGGFEIERLTPEQRKHLKEEL